MNSVCVNLHVFLWIRSSRKYKHTKDVEKLCMCNISYCLHATVHVCIPLSVFLMLFSSEKIHSGVFCA